MEYMRIVKSIGTGVFAIALAFMTVAALLPSCGVGTELEGIFTDSPSGPKRNCKLVYIIDDSQTSRLKAESVALAIRGTCTRAFSNPLTAIRAIPSDVPDLIVTDYHMEEMSGDKVVQEATRLGIVSIVITTLPTPLSSKTSAEGRNLVKRLKRIGAREVVNKPDVDAKLHDVIEAIIYPNRAG
jgi:CheY-like chemotaxis protein